MNVLLLILFVIQTVAAPFAQPATDPEALFSAAAAHYEKREFAEAAAAYEAIIAAGFRTSAIEYNLGNCLFREGLVGMARLHYERALRLSPGDRDAAANVQFIESRYLKQGLWEENFSSIDRVLWGVVTVLPKDLLAGIGLGAWVLLNGIIAWSMLRRGAKHRALRWTAGILLVIVAALALGAAEITDSLAATTSYGIVTAADVSVSSEPNRSAPSRFPAPEGMKVIIARSQGDWKEILLPNGAKGWVRGDMVAVI